MLKKSFYFNNSQTKIDCFFHKERIADLNIIFYALYESKLCTEALSLFSKQDDAKIIFNEQTMSSKGLFNSKTSTITIRANLDLKQSVTTILFELSNANNSALIHEKIQYNLFPSAKEYAIYIELAEHNSYKQAAKLYTDLVNSTENFHLMLTNDEVDEFAKLLDFNNAIKNVQDNGHYQSYIKEYNAALPVRQIFFPPVKNSLARSTANSDNLASSSSLNSSP